ncbi:MAG: beta-lactamase family protein [Chloroflexi bacterium]|nr:beta-lactamase family protein [Chloroflexota bacterium]
MISLMTALAITGLACGGPTATPGTSTTPTPVVTPTPTLVAATPSPTATPTTIPTPTSVDPSDEEAGRSLYEDSSGLFSVPIPANWTVEGRNGYGILTAPDEDLTFYVLAVEGSDVESAIVDAWALVDPEFDLAPNDLIEQPATGGLERVVFIPYNTDDESKVVLAGAQLYQGVVYVLLGRGEVIAFQQRQSQVAIIGTGLTINALEHANLTGVEPLRLTADLLAEFEAYILDAMKLFNIPGAAVSVVQDGEIIYAEGFGVRELGKNDPVTPETLMMVGSVTKSMTTMLMATLVDDGLMDWDTPVIDVIPTFALADPELTQEITLRNLVCACTGVPRRDFEVLMNYDDLSAEDIVESLASFELFTDFGEAFQYSNQMVATGGYAAAAVAGAEYGSLYNGYMEAVEERVFTPIGMTSTTSSFQVVLASNNYGTPHGLDLDFQYYPISLQLERVTTPIAPAGAMWSNVQDLGRYLITELDQGVVPSGPRVVSAENLKVTWEPQVPISADVSYGLGWMVGEYKGLPQIWHEGNTMGFTATLAFLPDQDLGISILSNARGSNGFNQAIRFRLFELAFGLESEFQEQAEFGLMAARDTIAELAADLVDIGNELVAPYLGRYSNDVLGEITIELEDGKLIMDVGEFRSRVGSKAGEDGGDASYILSDSVLLGLPIKFDESDSSNLIVVLGVGVVEYTFQKVP